MDSKMLLAGAGFGLMLASGLWLSHSARPYSIVVLTLHKLISLGTLAYLAYSVVQYRKNFPFATGLLLACGVALLAFLALIATGGILSAAKTSAVMAQKIHAVMPYVAILAAAAGLVLMRTVR